MNSMGGKFIVTIFERQAINAQKAWVDHSQGLKPGLKKGRNYMEGAGTNRRRLGPKVIEQCLGNGDHFGGHCEIKIAIKEAKGAVDIGHYRCVAILQACVEQVNNHQGQALWLGIKTGRNNACQQIDNGKAFGGVAVGQLDHRLHRQAL